jgi:hypothetical protein
MALLTTQIKDEVQWYHMRAAHKLSHAKIDRCQMLPLNTMRIQAIKWGYFLSKTYELMESGGRTMHRLDMKEFMSVNKIYNRESWID